MDEKYLKLIVTLLNSFDLESQVILAINVLESNKNIHNQIKLEPAL
jgi:hypothetical protein